MTALIKRCEVRTSTIRGAGRGLFAKRGARTGDVVDETPALFADPPVHVPSAWTEHIYRLDDGTRVLPLGDGVFVNHSDDPNVEPRVDRRRKIVKLVAVRPIRAGEEVFFDYGADW